MEISGARAVVTGGASGIGRAIAEELVSKHCRVLLADIDGARARAVATELGELATGAQCDVSDYSAVLALVEVAVQTLGAVDLLFANAGVSVGGPLLDASPEALDWIFGVNVRGTWNTVSVFGQKMRESRRPAHICITGSEHSIGMQHAGMGLYTATKMAVLGLADVLRAELPLSMGVSVLCPGLVATELYLSKRTSPLPQDPDIALAFAGAVMAKGMTAHDVGKAAVEGVERGDFLIVTHPAALAAATVRSDEIAAAFAAQAPWSPDAARYHVNAAIASVGQAWAERHAKERAST